MSPKKLEILEIFGYMSPLRFQKMMKYLPLPRNICTAQKNVCIFEKNSAMPMKKMLFTKHLGTHSDACSRAQYKKAILTHVIAVRAD